MTATSETRVWDAVVTSTLAASAGELQDNIHKSVPFLAYSREAGKVLKLDGGQRIKADLMYGKNTTVVSKDPYDLVNTTPMDGITAAFFDWKEVAGTLSISRKERRQNSGKHKMFDLLESKKRQLEASCSEAVTTMLLGDGTGNGGKDIEGLQIAVPDTPTTGTYGGVNRAVETWWQNQYEGSVGAFATNGLNKIREFYRKASQGNVKGSPDFIMLDGDLYDSFEAEHVLHLQLAPTGKMSEAMANLGIESFKYKRAQVFYEEQMASSGRIYLLNTDFLKLAIDKESDFVMGPAITPHNQTQTTAVMILMANYSLTNARKQAVLTGVS